MTTYQVSKPADSYYEVHVTVTVEADRFDSVDGVLVFFDEDESAVAMFARNQWGSVIQQGAS